MMDEKNSQKSGRKIKIVMLGIAALLLMLLNIATSLSKESEHYPVQANVNFSKSLKDSVDAKTGLIIAPGFAVVSTTCVRCHSPKLITEKRATREGWLATIRWMQQTQGLWDLGKDEPVLLDYLAKNNPLKNEGRRPPLKTPEWY
ncbi:MAG: monoheme cytochrome C, partial [Bacteroidota bacterium]|nr:monoheme cytochrome C [Bacteroidota bacterium]